MKTIMRKSYSQNRKRNGSVLKTETSQIIEHKSNRPEQNRYPRPSQFAKPPGAGLDKFN